MNDGHMNFGKSMSHYNIPESARLDLPQVQLQRSSSCLLSTFTTCVYTACHSVKCAPNDFDTAQNVCAMVSLVSHWRREMRENSADE